METILRGTVRFLTEEDGPTASEYAVMLALIAIAAMVTMASFGSRVDAMYTAIASAVGLL